MTDDLTYNPILFSQSDNGPETYGMELRDWFAGQALAGLLVANAENPWDDIQDTAYELAERMLQARQGLKGDRSH